MMAAPKTGAAERPWDKGKRVVVTQSSSNAIDLSQKKMSTLTCYSCGGLGHHANECNTPFKGTWRGGRGSGSSVNRGHGLQRGSAARGRGGRGGTPKDRSRSQSPGGRGRGAAARGQGQARGRAGGASERGRGRGASAGRNVKRSSSTGGTPRGRSPAGGRRANSSDPVKKRVSFEANAQDEKKPKICYYCGLEGHVAKECTNEKSLRAKKLPWPQNRRIEQRFTQLNRLVVKDWTSEELSMANEMVRLAELQIDAKLNVVRAAKEIELAGVLAKKKISFWCRATNTRTEIEFQPSNNSREETGTRLLLWKEDIIVTTRSLESQMDLFMRTVEITATAKVKQAPRIQTTSAQVNKILGKIWPKPERAFLEDEGVQVPTHGNLLVEDLGIDAGIYVRVHAAAEFVERLYAELNIVTRQTVVDGITQVVEKHARKEAMGRKENVETAGKEKKPVEVPLTVMQLKELAAADLVKRNAIIEGAKSALSPLVL